MGNGPGDLEEYFQRTYQYDGYAGGFVWEWCDHSIYMGKTVNGKDKYYYGGDRNETLHDGNFCMDGLVYPDRTPHIGLLEFKNVARPIRASWKHGQPGVVVLENKMNYINIRDRYDICYEVVRDGKKEQTGILETVDCPAGECIEIEIPCVLDAEGNTSLHLRY